MFVRRDDSKKKSDTLYDPRPLIVVEKKGSMVNAQDNNGIPVGKFYHGDMQGSCWGYKRTWYRRCPNAVQCHTVEMLPAACEHVQQSRMTMFVADSGLHTKCVKTLLELCFWTSFRHWDFKPFKHWRTLGLSKNVISVFFVSIVLSFICKFYSKEGRDVMSLPDIVMHCNC